MIRRRRNETLTRILLAMGAFIAVLLVLVVVTAVKKIRQQAVLQEEWLDARDGQEDAEPPPPPDPWEGKQDQAIQAVRNARVAGGETIGARVRSQALVSRVDALRRPGVQEMGWQARRIRDYSIYSVQLVYRFHHVDFGPRWYVQLDPEGMTPEGSGGVVPANGLAQQLHKADLDDNIRYLNRTDEVLEALTSHRFQNGNRLGSILLVFFSGQAQGVERSIGGWHVVPEQTNPDDDLMYHAYFQWTEDGLSRNAWWEVNLTTQGFQARDLQANEIMALGSTLREANVVDIRPRSLDLSTPPESETRASVRALRYLLADDRLVEAVGTLLGYQGGNRTLEYRGWEPNVTEERHLYNVACIFSEDDVEKSATWQVDANTGAITATSEIAQTVELVLRQAPITAP